MLELELERLQSEGRRHVLYGAINLCAMPATPQPQVGYQGAWLSRLENFKTAADVRRVVEQKVHRMRRQPGASERDCGEPAPFATGDLQVMDNPLAGALFERCTCLKRFVRAGRRANRQSKCTLHGKQFESSWATLTCDWCARHQTSLIGPCVSDALPPNLAVPLAVSSPNAARRSASARPLRT